MYINLHDKIIGVEIILADDVLEEMNGIVKVFDIRYLFQSNKQHNYVSYADLEIPYIEASDKVLKVEKEAYKEYIKSLNLVGVVGCDEKDLIEKVNIILNLPENIIKIRY